MKATEVLFYTLSVAALGWLAVALAKRMAPPAPAAIKPVERVEVSVAPILAPFAAALEATRRPSLAIALEPMATDDVLASKVGGRAYWPDDAEYPRGENGQPLFLLAQIDFAAAPKLDGYPESGMLQFFIAADDYYGANFDAGSGGFAEQKNFRVVYWPAPLAPAGHVPRPSSTEDTYLPMDPAKPRRMQFAPGSETMGAGDAGMAAILGQDVYALAVDYAKRSQLPEDSVVDALYTALSRTGHKLGGYPYFTQEDPRQASDARVLLMQLDTDDRMMWGDAGVANFFIAPGDLARRDFSRVMYNWDCH